MFNKTFLPLILAMLAPALYATQPPTKEQISKYKQDGTYEQRVEAVKSLNNHHFNPALVRTFAKNHFTGKEKALNTLDQGPTPIDGAFPSIGSPKMLVLLVEFPDYPKNGTNTRESVHERIFGAGNPEEFPYDSQRNFYLRSSYNKLDIQGNVLDWYKTDYNRPLEDSNNSWWQVWQRIIKDAINYHEAQGHDFSQYDNDNDGDIDYAAVIWTGPTGEWASLWWGTFSGFGDDSFTVDGKTLSNISWQQISYQEDEGPFSPSTLIHETGHALGLPDYYDYNDDIGPKGGLGGMDQMAGNHDHNSFSKYVLGWLTPTVIGSGAQNVSLLPFSEKPSALLLNKDATADSKWEEFYIVEYRNRNANDQNLPNDGMVVWHVDATINEWGWFENNNSFSDDKLIRLVQADGLNEIELYGHGADAEDFFTTGDEFSPNSRPQSHLNNGEHSGVALTNINHSEANIALNAEVYPSVPRFTIENISDKSVIRVGQSISINVDTPTELDKLELYSNDQLVYSFAATSPFELDLTNDLLNKGSQELKIVATNQQGYKSTEFRDIVYLDGQPSNLLINLDAELDEPLNDMMAKAGMSVVHSEYFLPLSVQDFPVVHLNFGAVNSPWTDVGGGVSSSTFIGRAASTDEIAIIENYLTQGGNLILEGEGVFGLTSALQSLFDIGIAQSGINLNRVSGDSLFDNKTVDTDLSSNPRLISADLFESGSEQETTDLLTGTGSYYDSDAAQWLDVSGSCAQSKTVGAANAKVVIASCLTRYLANKDKAAVYNTYLAHFGVEQKLSGNTVPQINGGNDIAADERSVVNLSGVANDADGDSLSVNWAQLSGAVVSLNNNTTLTPSFTAPEVTEDQVLEFQLTVSDGEATVTDTVRVTVKHVNRIPTVSAGTAQTINEGTSVTISATADDADGDTLTITWTQTAGTTVSLSGGDSLTASFVAPQVSSDMTLTFQVNVSDGEEEAVDSVSITVRNTSTDNGGSNGDSSGSSGGGTSGFLLLLISALVLWRREQSISK